MISAPASGETFSHDKRMRVKRRENKSKNMPEILPFNQSEKLIIWKKQPR
jgi:hypothetical protein